MLKKIILSVIFLVFTILVISEIALRNIPNDYQYKANYLKKNGQKIETLILGSSHTFTGLNPSLFSTETFNVAHSAQSLDLDYKILEQNIHVLTQLKTIIIPISYFSFVSQLDDFSADKLKYYSIYWKLNTEYIHLNNRYEILSAPIDFNYTRLKDHFIHQKNNLTIDTKGYIKNRYEPEWNDRIYTKITFPKHRFNMTSVKVQHTIKTHFRYLENIIIEAKAKQIQVVLLMTPTTNIYRNEVKKTPQYMNLKNNVKILSKNENVLVLDYFTTNHDFKKSDFKNSDHLNAKGANKLTTKVDSVISKTNL